MGMFFSMVYITPITVRHYPRIVNLSDIGIKDQLGEEVAKGLSTRVPRVHPATFKHMQDHMGEFMGESMRFIGEQ